MRSMTGFAAATGEHEGKRWRWEAKSVNGRGLDLRFRLAEGIDAREAALRAAAAKALARGNVTIGARMEDAGDAGVPRLNEAALDAAIAAASKAEAAADRAGLSLAPTNAAGLLALRGVMDAAAPVEADDKAFASAVDESFAALLGGLNASREEEGARLADVIAAMVDAIADLAARAAAAFEEQQGGAPAALAAKVAAVMEAGADVEPERLAQEVALLAVKADVREELDRLGAHVEAARALIVADGPVGRKLDFLTQEFNREVNTICSKSGSSALTAIGLELKVVVDQMREQAQNVE